MMGSEPALTSIVSTADRPDLFPLVARWLWVAFWGAGGRSLEDTVDAVRRSVTAAPMPRTFVLLADGRPVGTASLVAHDPDERPELTPWLAGMFVEPDVRGRGYAGLLIGAVEAAARHAAIPTLWLYTNAAERIYARAGWRTVETFPRHGKVFALMRRDVMPRSEQSEVMSV